MGRQEDLEAKAARMKEAAARRNAAATTEVRSPAPSELRTSVPGTRARTVRLTVDVPPQDHTELLQWCLGAAGQLGVTRVTGQEVLRTLLNKFLTDDKLGEQVLADIARQHSL